MSNLIGEEDAIYHGRMFRMPDGNVTRDQDEYLKAWTELGAKVAALFPGYRIGGYDPDILLHPEDYADGSFSIPARAALALVSKVDGVDPET